MDKWKAEIVCDGSFGLETSMGAYATELRLYDPAEERELIHIQHGYAPYCKDPTAVELQAIHRSLSLYQTKCREKAISASRLDVYTDSLKGLYLIEDASNHGLSCIPDSYQRTVKIIIDQKKAIYKEHKTFVTLRKVKGHVDNAVASPIEMAHNRVDKIALTNRILYEHYYLKPYVQKEQDACGVLLPSNPSAEEKAEYMALGYHLASQGIHVRVTTNDPGIDPATSTLVQGIALWASENGKTPEDLFTSIENVYNTKNAGLWKGCYGSDALFIIKEYLERTYPQGHWNNGIVKTPIQGRRNLTHAEDQFPWSTLNFSSRSSINAANATRLIFGLQQTGPSDAYGGRIGKKSLFTVHGPEQNEIDITQKPQDIGQWLTRINRWNQHPVLSKRQVMEEMSLSPVSPASKSRAKSFLDGFMNYIQGSEQQSSVRLSKSNINRMLTSFNLDVASQTKSMISRVEIKNIVDLFLDRTDISSAIYEAILTYSHMKELHPLKNEVIQKIQLVPQQTPENKDDQPQQTIERSHLRRY